MLKLIILIAIINSIKSQGNVGPFDPRCPVVDDSVNPAHLPHETYCTKFYKCFDRMRIEFDCPPSLEWGHMEICIGVWCACEWPWSAQCYPQNLPPLPTDPPPTNWTTTTPITTPSTTTQTPTTTRPTTTTTTTTQTPTTTRPTTTTTTTTAKPLTCPSVDNPFNPIFIPHEHFCDQYYLCHRGSKISRNCAFGLFWDQKNLWCDFPWNVPSCQQNCPNPDDVNQPIFLPNYDFCDRYFLCFNSTKIPRSCASGLQWSRQGEWCDYAENIRCGYTGYKEKGDVVGVAEMVEFKIKEEL